MVRIPTAPKQPAAGAPQPSRGDRQNRQLFNPLCDDFVSPLVLDFTILIDHRERSAGWRFQNIIGDAADDNRPLIVPQREVHLVTGDYMVQAGPGGKRQIVVERKSAEDIVGSVGGGHHNFRKEHERMLAITEAGGACCVVIEGGFDAILTGLEDPTSARGLNPHSLEAVAASWPTQFRVPWVWAGSRRRAELYALRFLRTWWKKFSTEAKGK